MADVVFENVSKTFDNKARVVQNINLNVADAEFMVIVGPSGCGKTTTLRMLAGLEEITEGAIRIGGLVVNNIPPKDRDIAMVFQNYALYPHMSVYENMAFGLKLRKYPKMEIENRVKKTAAMLGIENLLDRKPKALSGGQRQRVALGRAIVRSPKVFLFDEPLSNLDAKLRVSTRAELKSLHHHLKTTSIYVTHDQAEAMTLGDRICVMYDGIIQQVAKPMNVYQEPVNRFVAGFLGTPPMNFLNGKIMESCGMPVFCCSNFQLSLERKNNTCLRAYVNREMILGIRPENISVRNITGQVGNVIPATVNIFEPLGDHIDVYFSTADGSRFICVSDPSIPLQLGQKLEFYVNLEKVHIFEPGENGKNITLP